MPKHLVIIGVGYKRMFFFPTSTIQLGGTNRDLPNLQPVLQQKLKYAINFCKSLDTDEYARVAIPGNAIVSTTSDSEDMESIASDSCLGPPAYF